MLIQSATEVDLHIRSFWLDSVSEQLPYQMLFKLLCVYHSDNKAKNTDEQPLYAPDIRQEI